MADAHLGDDRRRARTRTRSSRPLPRRCGRPGSGLCAGRRTTTSRAYSTDSHSRTSPATTTSTPGSRSSAAAIGVEPGSSPTDRTSVCRIADDANPAAAAKPLLDVGGERVRARPRESRSARRRRPPGASSTPTRPRARRRTARGGGVSSARSAGRSPACACRCMRSWRCRSDRPAEVEAAVWRRRAGTAAAPSAGRRSPRVAAGVKGRLAGDDHVRAGIDRLAQDRHRRQRRRHHARHRRRGVAGLERVDRSRLSSRRRCPS